MDHTRDLIMPHVQQVVGRLGQVQQTLDRLDSTTSGASALQQALLAAPLLEQRQALRRQLAGLLDAVATPLEVLKCCRCSAATVGRPWPPLAPGYGLCAACGCGARAGLTADDMLAAFGVEQVHYGLLLSPQDAHGVERPAMLLRRLRHALEEARLGLRGTGAIALVDQALRDSAAAELPEWRSDPECERERLALAQYLVVHAVPPPVDASAAPTPEATLWQRAMELAYNALTPALRKVVQWLADNAVQEQDLDPLAGAPACARLVELGLAVRSAGGVTLSPYGRWAVAQEGRLALLRQRLNSLPPVQEWAA